MLTAGHGPRGEKVKVAFQNRGGRGDGDDMENKGDKLLAMRMRMTINAVNSSITHRGLPAPGYLMFDRRQCLLDGRQDLESSTPLLHSGLSMGHWPLVVRGKGLSDGGAHLGVSTARPSRWLGRSYDRMPSDTVLFFTYYRRYFPVISGTMADYEERVLRYI